MRHILPDECDALLEAITTTDPSVAIRVNDGQVACHGAPRADT